jgi:ribosomal protein L11 methyltransferase
VTGIEEAGVAPPAPGRASLEAHLPATRCHDARADLLAYLDHLALLEPAARTTRVELPAPVPTVDWDAVFRQHHRPLRIGTRLLVAPPWEVPDGAGRLVLVVEPGMAFGTGQHATTRTCLEEVEAAALERGVRSALDVGTGSAVLATALARLGVPRVVAVDDDPVTLPWARDTLRRNDAEAVHLVCGTLASLDAEFDLVVANLLADVLEREAAALGHAVAPGGRLVVSGLLGSQVTRVLAAYPGWRTTATRADADWRTLRLERR